MRLLYVIDSLAPGGAETSLLEMAPGLVAHGIDLHVLPLGPRRDLAPELDRAGATVHLADPSNGRVAGVRTVMDVGRYIRPHLVHTTLYEADVAGRTAAKRLSIPSSTSIVGDSYSARHYRESSTTRLHAARALDAVTARWAARFHVLSEALACSVPPRLHIPRAKVDVVPRGRDSRRFPLRTAEQRRRVRGELGLPAGVPVILAVGRQDPAKGLGHLVDAVPRVAQDHPDVVVLIAGKTGSESAELRRKAQDVGRDIRFLGHRSDVPALLAAADVLCFPSEREGFGGVLIEAMAVGCPVVASAIPSSIELLGAGEAGAGILTPPGEWRQLASALSRVLADPQGCEPLTRRARGRFEAEFTIDRVASRMAGFFTGVAAPG